MIPDLIRSVCLSLVGYLCCCDEIDRQSVYLLSFCVTECFFMMVVFTFVACTDVERFREQRGGLGTYLSTGQEEHFANLVSSQETLKLDHDLRKNRIASIVHQDVLAANVYFMFLCFCKPYL